MQTVMICGSLYEKQPVDALTAVQVSGAIQEVFEEFGKSSGLSMSEWFNVRIKKLDRRIIKALMDIALEPIGDSKPLSELIANNVFTSDDYVVLMENIQSFFESVTASFHKQPVTRKTSNEKAKKKKV